MVCVILEGWNDFAKVNKVYPGLDIVVTEGTKINNKLRRKINSRLNKGVDVYIMSDPDEAGDQLAHMLNSEFPTLPRIKVNREEANYFTGRKVRYGVEYMSEEAIRNTLGGLVCAHAEIVENQE